jgi:hypothetical protein
VNHETISANTFRTELSAISHNNDLQCFITALSLKNYAPGAGGYSIKAAGAAGWANLRIEGMTINQYVTKKWGYHPDAAQLAEAKSSLEGEMTEQATANSLKCPGTSTEALAAMPSEMRTAEIQAQATSLYLVKKIKTAIPLTAASMQSFYTAHPSDYDTLCVSVAVVLPTEVSAFEKAQSAGASVATLAREYSQDPTASKGGAAGCFAPSSTSYESVRSDVASLALNTFATTPNYIDDQGTTYALYVAVTKRTTTPFSVAEPTVLTDLQNLNASSANQEKNRLLYNAAVHVDPAFGQWGLNTTGPEVFAPSIPTKSDVTGTKKLNATGSATYQ